MFKKSSAYPGARRRPQAQQPQYGGTNGGPHNPHAQQGQYGAATGGPYNPHAGNRAPGYQTQQTPSGGAPPPLSDPHGWFTYFDRDGSGSLDQEEVIAGLVRTHPNLDATSVREQVYAVWPAFDADGSGRVERNEFCAPGGMGEALLAATQPARAPHVPGASSQPAPSAGNGGGGPWTCERCTFVNGEENQRCKACHHPKPVGAGASGGGGGGGAGPYVPGATAAAAQPYVQGQASAADSSSPYVPTATSAPVAGASGPYVPGAATTATAASGPYVPGAAATAASGPYVPGAAATATTTAQPYVPGAAATAAATAASHPYVPGASPFVPGAAAPAAPPAHNPHYVPSAPPAPTAPPASPPYNPTRQEQFQTVRVNIPTGMLPGQQLGVKTGPSSDTTLVTIPGRDQWRYPPGGAGGAFFDVRVPAPPPQPRPAGPVVVEGKYAGAAAQPQQLQPAAQQQLLPWQSWDSFGGSTFQPIPLGMQTVPPEQVAPQHSVASVPPTGRKRALLVGINYRGTRAELRGCVNDARNMREVLMSQGFRDDPSHMVMLVDEGTSSRYKPTKQNLMRGMQWLVHNAVPGDVLFFHFSGHGAQMADKTGHEADGFNETILPVDFKSAGQITDDVIWGNIVWPLPGGVRLMALMDCCHSGTGLDLPFEYDLRKRRWAEDINPAHSKGDVVQFSGCEDAQTSADAGGDALSKYQAGGAMTQSFIRAFKENPHATYPQLMEAIHRQLKRRGFSQRPALTASQSFDVATRVFSLAEGIEPNRNSQIGRIKRRHIRPGKANGSVQERLFGMATGASALAGAMALGSIFLGD